MTRHILLTSVLLLTSACSGPPTTTKSAAASKMSDPAPPPAYRNTPALIVDGNAIQWRTLVPLLAEAAGDRVTAEVVLDVRLKATLARRGLKVGETQVAAERELMLQRFMEQGLARDEDQAMRVLNRLREDRGLGPKRFDLFLRRNASLRALVADESQVSDAMLQQEYERRYGERIEIRMIVVPLLADAERVRDRLDAGEPFAKVASELSIHPSSVLGGLLRPFSRIDPDIEQAIRDVAFQTDPGQTSDPISAADGFAVIRVDQRIEAESVPLDDVRDELTRVARLRVEQVMMNRQARVLLESADVSVLDAHLDRLWQAQRRQMLQSE